MTYVGTFGLEMNGTCNLYLLTCPLSSIWLLVNFSLSKETTCFIHWAPVAGLSGCTCILGGETGSAFPAITQLELIIFAQWVIMGVGKMIFHKTDLWKAYRYLLSSNGTKSIMSMYSECGSKPQSLTWKVGNILLPAFVTIISVPKEWNSSHKGFISNNAPAVLRAGDKVAILQPIKTIKQQNKETYRTRSTKRKDQRCHCHNPWPFPKLNGFYLYLPTWNELFSRLIFYYYCHHRFLNLLTPNQRV